MANRSRCCGICYIHTNTEFILMYVEGNAGKLYKPTNGWVDLSDKKQELDLSSGLELPDICNQEPTIQIKPTLNLSTELPIDYPEEGKIHSAETVSNEMNCDVSRKIEP